MSVRCQKQVVRPPCSSFCFLVLFCLLGPPWQHMEVPRLGSNRSCSCYLRQSHSNRGSELCRRPAPQLTAMSDPRPTEQGQGSNRILMGSSWIRFCRATRGTPVVPFRVTDVQNALQYPCFICFTSVPSLKCFMLFVLLINET